MTRPSSNFLERFQLDGIHATGRTVGDGAYATVLEYDFRGLTCVGKKIHRALYEHASVQEKADIMRRFEAECELLSQLHHPKIVQFLGVHVEASSVLPALVMEYLPTNLSTYLDRNGVPPVDVSYGILHDVALGLRYLHEHNPPIIHRDLSANNVLLTENASAKIADLGVAKILNLSPQQITKRMSTQAPGTPCYMPPEALITQPAYNSKIDCFAFGVLILHVLCGRWPLPADLFQPDPHNPGTLMPVTESDRRMTYLQEIGLDHPLAQLACHCLNNTTAQRPPPTEILHEIRSAMAQESLLPHRNSVPRKSCDGGVRERLLDASAEIERLQREIDSLLDARHMENTTKEVSSKEAMTSFFHPHAKIRWQPLPDAPVEMYRAQAVLIGEEVYIGGGVTLPDKEINPFLAFRYNWRHRVWNTLPLCPVKLFALASFGRELITIGGADIQYVPIGTVYRLSDDMQNWEERLVPMPTARYQLSVATTPDAIVAAGGATGMHEGTFTLSNTVEVYYGPSGQWHSTEPLPALGHAVSSLTTGDAFYLMGARGSATECMYAFLSSLTKKALSPAPTSPPCTPKSPLWKFLPQPPLRKAVGTSMGGALMALGGFMNDDTRSPAVHVFLPLANAWVRIDDGDLPFVLSSFSAVQVSPSDVIVFGGLDDRNDISRMAFTGTIYTD